MAVSWRERIHRGCTNIAHRGARSLGPENTLAAAKRALEAGAGAWELDVRMTADGALAVVHDATLARTSNAAEVFPGRRPWSVRDFTLHEIRALDFGSWFGKAGRFGRIRRSAAGAADADRFRGEPAPTLEEALAFTAENGWLVNVEIKDLEGAPEHEEVAEAVAGLIQKMGMQEKVLVSSFNHGYLERVKRVDEQIPTGVLVSAPHRDPADQMRRLCALTYHPAVRALLPGQVEGLSRLGLGVLVWTANNRRLMRLLVAAGVHGIFTDFPQRLRGVVE